MACQKGHSAVVSLLLEHDADTRVTTNVSSVNLVTANFDIIFVLVVYMYY